ncbi:MAG: outer membrane lipoprotein-sorting protein [Bacteroidetes bacterium 4572_77]|nr:MAG: outer membrane lipoprotein-sorting protein [Bacteroidetes bacterium 4572_77]
MNKIIYISFLLAFFSFSGLAQDITALQIVIKADDLQRGESNEGEMTMTIIRPKWERSISMKTWSLGRDYSMTYITSPVKDKGQVFLKRESEMWNWMPTINRMIKLPPSMMSQGWMGSDYSNDDILKESSIVVDYTHKILAEEKVNGIECYKLELLPKEDAAVVWGKVLKWISKEEFWQLKTCYYDEDDDLIRTEMASEVKQFGDRKLPSRVEIIPADKPGQKTVITITKSNFKVKLSDSFFSQQNMKRIR